MEAIRGFYENYIRWSAASMTLSDVLEIAIFTYFHPHIPETLYAFRLAKRETHEEHSK